MQGIYVTFLLGYIPISICPIEDHNKNLFMGSGDLNISYSHSYSWPLDIMQTDKN